MIGTGDVVLTDINRSTSKLLIDENLEGKMLVSDLSGRPVAEFNKSYGQLMMLGISPGTYRVTNNKYNNMVDEARITIPGNDSYRLALNDFSRGTVEWTRVRGGKKENQVFDDFDSQMDNLFDSDEGGEYLIESGNMHFSGYGGPAVIFTSIAGEVGVFTGGKGGVILNDSFVFGGGGYGLVNPIRLSTYTDDQLPESNKYLNLGFGGFLFEYYYRPKSLITYSAGLLIGGGGYMFSDSFDSEGDTGSNGEDPDSFFSMHPELNMYINFTRFFRMGGGIGYVFFSGINSDYFEDDDFNGLSMSLVFQFGWF